MPFVLHETVERIQVKGEEGGYVVEVREHDVVGLESAEGIQQCGDQGCTIGARKLARPHKSRARSRSITQCHNHGQGVGNGRSRNQHADPEKWTSPQVETVGFRHRRAELDIGVPPNITIQKGLMSAGVELNRLENIVAKVIEESATIRQRWQNCQQVQQRAYRKGGKIAVFACEIQHVRKYISAFSDLASIRKMLLELFAVFYEKRAVWIRFLKKSKRILQTCTQS